MRPISAIGAPRVSTRESALSRPGTGTTRTVLQDVSSRVNATTLGTKVSHAFVAPLRKKRDENARRESLDRLGDARNARDAYEYDLEIYRYLREVECDALPSPAMFDIQSNITPRMRATVVDWIVDVHCKLRMHTETLYLAVNLIDQYLTHNNIDKGKFQRLACAAILIAAKNLEIYPPSVRKLVKLADQSFTEVALTRMEKTLLSAVGFRVDRVLPCTFLKRFLRLTESDNLKLSMLAHFLCDTSILDVEFIGMMPSKLAAAIVCLSVTLLRGAGQWTQYMVTNTGYSVTELEPIVQKLLQSVTTASTGRFQAIRRKYASKSMARVSGISFPEKIQLH